MSSAIVSVFVSHESYCDKEVLVYALLYSQSDTTFILNGTCTSIGLNGTEEDLLLSTMYAENKVINIQKISGLKVRGYNYSERLPLPTAYIGR